jgi:hypothetical protein
MAVERIEKSHREGQGGVHWQDMWQDHEMSKNRALRFNVHEDKVIGWKENRGILNTGIEDCEKNNCTSETSTENLGELCYRALRSAWSTTKPRSRTRRGRRCGRERALVLYKVNWEKQQEDEA